MAQGKLASDFAARRGKTHLAALHSYQAVFLKTSERHGYCRRRNRKPVGQGSRDDRGAFTLGLEDGLKIVLLGDGDRKSTRLNSSHLGISYAVFCLKKKNKQITISK